jgi:DNA-directed RNA polymerase specialized sigma54-like protein
MASQSQRNSQKLKETQRISAGHSQLQKLVFSQTHILEQMIQQELDQNPALEIETEPLDHEDIPVDEGDCELWNQDYDKPDDEYETGESTKAAEDFDCVEYDIANSLERAAFENHKK